MSARHLIRSERISAFIRATALEIGSNSYRINYDRIIFVFLLNANPVKD
jgi:hypothetical protein